MYSHRRIKLLSDQEIEDIYAIPELNNMEQALYFSLTEKERLVFERYRTVKSQVYFIKSLGYFKAKQQFYKFDLCESDKDTRYILENYFSKKRVLLSGQIDSKTYQKQKKDILMINGFRDWLPQYHSQIQLHLNELIKIYPKGHDALRQLLNYFEHQKIVLPSYRTLQDMFTAAYTQEEERLNKVISKIPESKKEELFYIINKNDGISFLNKLRSDQKDFKYTAMKAEIGKVLKIAELYEFSKSFLPSLKISKNAIRYYADLAEQYSASRLRRLTQSQQWLQALCFIYYRYQHMMDHLITSFIYHTRNILHEGKNHADKMMADHSSKLVIDLPNLAKFLKWFPNRKATLNHNEVNQEAYSILAKEQFFTLALFLEGKVFDKKAAKWLFYSQSSRQIALYLRPIMLIVPFVFYKNDSDIMKFIDFLKKYYGGGKSPGSFKLPKELKNTLPQTMIPYLKKNHTDDQVDAHLFEMFVYKKMYRYLEKGLLCCNNSISYCDIDHDLVDDSVVDDVKKIANEFGYSKIPIYCRQYLDEMLTILDNTWERVTNRINLGENAGLILKENKAGEQGWRLDYDCLDKLNDTFFKTLPQVDLPNIVMHIGDRIEMWHSFTHMKTRYHKKRSPVTLAVNACLLSSAFGIGEEKMAKMSDLSHTLLRSTYEDFIRLDTLCAANDTISNLLHSLPIFKQWNLMDLQLLADADGQKLATSKNTIQSRYSKKYLGKEPGLSLYTLTANFVAVNAKNIGLNEYEGHSLYDLIYGNKTDIEIDMVTGDNHSLNQLNFIILDSINVEYVPSIKNVKEATNELYSRKSIDSYTGLIRPLGVIDSSLIKSEERGILRLLLSLLLQENTQSNIVRKINSSARYASLKKALFEYNKVLKTIHILNLIDNMTLRKAIRAARNRTEAYHQLQGLIRKVYRGVFKGKRITTNRVNAQAVRLVANSIIAYNGIILNSVYEKMMRENVSQEIIREFIRISPIAWAHIAFTGKYSFKKSNGDIDISAMVETMEKHLKKHFWKGS